MKPYPTLYPADIGAIRGQGPLRWFSENLIEPKTDRVHYLVIGDYLPWDDDYVILESIGKGIAVGRLSFYRPEDIEIYRVPLNHEDLTPEVEMEFRSMAVSQLTFVGRARYDYLLIAQVALVALTFILRGKLPPWSPEKFPYGKNKAYICTEAAKAVANFLAASVDQSLIIPEGVVPLPAGFTQALKEGKIRRIFPDESANET